MGRATDKVIALAGADFEQVALAAPVAKKVYHYRHGWIPLDGTVKEVPIGSLKKGDIWREQGFKGDGYHAEGNPLHFRSAEQKNRAESIPPGKPSPLWKERPGPVTIPVTYLGPERNMKMTATKYAVNADTPVEKLGHFDAKGPAFPVTKTMTRRERGEAAYKQGRKDQGYAFSNVALAAGYSVETCISALPDLSDDELSELDHALDAEVRSRGLVDDDG